MSEGNGLPPGWVKTTLGQVFKWGSGGTPQSTNDAFYNGGIPWLVIGDLPDGVVSGSQKTISEAGLENSSAKWVQPGSVLVAMYGSIGKLGIASVELTTNQAIAFTDPEPVENRYLFYYLFHCRRELAGLGKGGTQQNISQTVIKAFPFILAPLAEQRRIVAAIEEQFARLDAGVAALERAQKGLKRYRASVLKAAVEGRLTEQWREENPDVESGFALLERILQERRARWEEADLARYAGKEQNPPKNWRSKYKEPAAPDTASLPELPEGWCWATVAQVSQAVRYGSSAKTSADSSGVPVLRMGNIQDGTLAVDNLKYLPSSHVKFPDLLLEQGDLLFNRTNSAELVGKSAVYKGTPSPCSYASYLIAVRLIEGCLPDYLNYFLNSSHGKAWIASVVSQQVGQANVNGTKLQALSFPLPPLAEQEEIVAEVERRLSVIDEVEAQVEAGLKRAARLRQSILKRAFEGKLVPQDPTDEPASVLLERIRKGREQSAAKKPKRKNPARKIPRGEQVSLFSAEGG